MSKHVHMATPMYKKRSLFENQRQSTLLDQYSLKQAKHNDLGYDFRPLKCLTSLLFDRLNKG